MGKTILYLAILLLLGFGIYYFIFSNPGSPYSGSEAGFTIKDTASIGKIFIAGADGESVLLERNDSTWLVNKKYKVLPSTLKMLLTTFTQQGTLYPVTKNAVDNVIKNLSTDGIKVEVYDRAGKKMRVFYVGGASVNNTGTNMLMDGASTPYVVQVPGFVGYITPRYTTRLSDWRDRTIFNIAPEEIKSVSMQYLDLPINSFTITREKDSLIVTADENLMKGLDGQNSRRAKIYMTYFTNVNCEGYLNGLEDMDTTIKTAPKESTIDITGMHGQHLHADIYWMALNKRSKNIATHAEGIPDDYDADRMYAIINNNQDTIMIQRFAFKNIFHKAFEFFQKDNTGENRNMATPSPKNVMMNKHP